MYKIQKVLSHNAVIAVSDENYQKYLLIGKGVGFGKKIAERITLQNEYSVYSLMETSERGEAEKIVKTVPADCLEVSNMILNLAEEKFGKIDRTILFSMADHIAFAIQRIKRGEQISNPLTEEIQAMFHEEYEIAKNIRLLMQKKENLEIDDDEIGYIALHVHSAIDSHKVSYAMQMARAVKESMNFLEEVTEQSMKGSSLSCNRLRNHIRYMILRSIKKEQLKVNVNDYMKIKFSKSFDMSKQVCDKMEQILKCHIEEVEIGYLAMHIERVLADE